MHCEFACLLYTMLKYTKLDQNRIYEIIGEAVEIEKEFITEALPVDLIGMNNGLMLDYIEFVSDRLLVALGYPKMYNTGNPFDWMTLISLTGKTSFFEKRVSEYAKANIMSPVNEAGFRLDVDF